ncbi:MULTISPECIES: flagellar basal-body rod protein FlgG [unclassified Fusibacter]|uniref:flagellar basal-body rod protein FlgG n=1 Tax=unclassified Fusibacter TaxID=2624464 RepID=UPI0010119E9C|nr:MULTISPECIES: flagellar basal-body rod protein FlgG [unclassified Fusibacter]MCK8059853.1 flagellar basal-body rod protein FlgG [Fusibacter sp. A2]NPE21655.1 flagellar basal-body rod protein FlgG [Fusibacter sp. A1]RXV62059.1 flagellar basal-body rod protein FlgG [Fusibacter sp. A1]
MRALWSAATGMKGLQLAIDTISNNLANVNTTGYKKQRIEFKDLLYEKLDNKDGSDGLGAPVNLEVGHGVMSSATVRNFGQGNIQATDNQLDVAIQGPGFFEIIDENDNVFYSKDGSFKLGLTEQGKRLVTSEGFIVNGVDGPIDLEGDIADLKIEQNGDITVKYADAEEGEYILVGTIKVVKIPNPPGLESKGLNLFKTSEASGEALLVDDGTAGTLMQGFLETSNVQVVEEMINLISMQRAYEINSKTIQTSDQMLELANNLKR